MNVRTRPSTRARMSGYAALASMAGAASTASAGVVIVDVRIDHEIFTFIDVSAAVGADVSYHVAVILQSGGGNIGAGGSGSSGNGLSFITAKWFGTNSVISNGAAGGQWDRGGWIGTLAEGATSYVGFRLPSGSSSDKVYGWIELTQVEGTGLQISRWAYESDVNTVITTPAASSNAVPGLGGLAALACGAAGMRRSRNRVA